MGEKEREDFTRRTAISSSTSMTSFAACRFCSRNSSAVGAIFRFPSRIPRSPVEKLEGNGKARIEGRRAGAEVDAG